MIVLKLSNQRGYWKDVTLHPPGLYYVYNCRVHYHLTATQHV